VEQTDDDLVRLIFQACAELSHRSGRSVSPDGHLVGSLGEIYAAQAFGLRLETASNAGFDAVDSLGRKVEIKTTTRASISLSASGTLAERLIVVQLDAETGAAQIIYDGDAAVAWEIAGKPGKSGQRRLSLAKLQSVAIQAVSETIPRIGRNQFDQ
jgi:hypothetical protein